MKNFIEGLIAITVTAAGFLSVAFGFVLYFMNIYKLFTIDFASDWGVEFMARLFGVCNPAAGAILGALTF